MKRVVFVIGGMDGFGGAERVISLLANSGVERGWCVSVLSYDLASRARSVYELHDKVNFELLGRPGPIRTSGEWISRKLIGSLSETLRRCLSRTFYGVTKENIGARRLNSVIGRMPIHLVQRIQLLRQRLVQHNPDVVIAFTPIPNIASIIGCCASGIPVIACERGNVGERVTDSPDLMAWRSWVYPCATRLVFQTERKLRDQPSSIRARSSVIPNPASAPTYVEHEWPVSKPAIAAMGSLLDDKGFDVVLRAFALTAERHDDWDLVIIGDGPERSTLVRLRDDLGLRQRVHFLGAVSKPDSLLQRAEIFVHASPSEGFPNAVVEALACGLPVVVVDCPYGPREIVRHGIDGLLAPLGDEPALAEHLASLMSDPGKRSQMSRRALEVTERFAVLLIMDKWAELIEEAIDDSPGSH
ncbi:MAG: glycosyltransferase family 4 protein [bacterium]|nr:glycosyltransferase family 4 protein [bacterium]